MNLNKILLILLVTTTLFNLQTKNKEKFSKKSRLKIIIVTFYNPGKTYLKKCLKS